jgi:NAD(P)-dependent dehydrogenase (short-subunit alcohol dehydrogenase family)
VDFSGKVVVITGGGSGIGQACAREFADRHAAVAAVDRDAKAGEQTVSELEARTSALSTSRRIRLFEPKWNPLVPQIVLKLGGIDVLVNNAGIQRYGTVTTLSEEEWDEVMNVNLKGAFLMSKYAISRMIERGGGTIVITGSVQSVAAQRNSVH